MLNHDPLLDLSKERGGQLYDKHHELQYLQYAKLKKQLLQVKVKAKRLYTIAIYLEKRENNRQKIKLMLDSKNLADLQNFLSPFANYVNLKN